MFIDIIQNVEGGDLHLFRVGLFQYINFKRLSIALKIGRGLSKSFDQ